MSNKDSFCQSSSCPSVQQYKGNYTTAIQICIAGINSGCAGLNLLRHSKCTKARGQGTWRYYQELSRQVSTRCCKTSEYRVYLKSIGLFSSCLHEGRQTDMTKLMYTPLYVSLRSRSIGISRSKLPHSTAETQAVAHCVCSWQPAVEPTEQSNIAQTHTYEVVLGRRQNDTGGTANPACRPARLWPTQQANVLRY